MVLLQTTSNIYIVKISAIFKPLKINTVIKRTMMRNAINHTNNLVRPIHFQGFSQRHYPGHFRAVVYKKDVEPVSGFNNEIPLHEKTHVNLQEVSTSKIYGVFTSHPPKKPDPRYHKLADKKMDGTKGTQHVGLYNNPKISSDDVEILEVEKKHQAFIDKHEALLKQAVESKKYTICEDRTSKDSSKFFNEDGTRDDENFPFK